MYADFGITFMCPHPYYSLRAVGARYLQLSVLLLLHVNTREKNSMAGTDGVNTSERKRYEMIHMLH